ncbi:hypothetical protein [Streptomyces hydrogenans]
MTRRTPALRTTALLLTAGLALAGCSTPADDDAKKNDPVADATAVAVAYKEAALALDWPKACELSTPRLRRGTVQECADRHPTPAASTPTPSPTRTRATAPPTYADGGAIPTLTPRTPSGPERATTGPVTVQGAAVDVAAAGDHPAGYGVLLTHTVTWPGKPASTSRTALRVVAEGDTWRIDQHEDIQDGDMRGGDPIRAALGG